MDFILYIYLVLQKLPEILFKNTIIELNIDSTFLYFICKSNVICWCPEYLLILLHMYVHSLRLLLGI